MAQCFVHQVVRVLAPDWVPLFLTDGYQDYLTALLTHFGSWVALPRKRAQGPVPKPRWTPLTQLLYAQVIKTMRRRRLVRVSHRAVFGTRAAIERWPRKKTYACPLADHALYQALPAVPRRRAENGRGCGARLEPPVLLPGACGHARVESGHGPPRLPTPACRLPSGRHPAALRRGQSRLTSIAQALRQCGS